jgi:hypothetical protein
MGQAVILMGRMRHDEMVRSAAQLSGWPLSHGDMKDAERWMIRILARSSAHYFFAKVDPSRWVSKQARPVRCFLANQLSALSGKLQSNQGEPTGTPR